MNAGFGSLTYLKSQLLAEALRVDESYDDQLLAIGLGVVGSFENFCQRPFARTSGKVEILPADHHEFLLTLIPIESISAIALKLSEADGWETQTINDFVSTIDLAAGIVHLAGSGDAGPHYGQVRFTYTGGYWWDETEDESDTLPNGATEIPDDLKLAWILQAKEVWNQTDRLGTGIIALEKSKTPTFKELELIPAVKQILGDYVRFNLT